MAARVAETASSMRCFFSLSSTSVWPPTLMTTTPPAIFASRSWSFSLSQSESERSISARICATRAVDVGRVAPAVDDRGVVLGDDDATCAAEHLEADLVELEPHLGRHDLGTGEQGEVLQDRLATVAEGRGLDGAGREGAADAVDDQGRQRLAVDVLGDDQQRLAGLDDLLQQRQQLLDRRDLALDQQDARVLEDGLHAVGIGDEVRRDEALVELHALGELQLEGRSCWTPRPR